MNTEYDIIEHQFLGDLKSIVRQKIKEGWVPQGGVCVTSDRDSRTNEHRKFYQALIRSDSPGAGVKGEKEVKA